ncbi:hypothetical protein C8F04DRAFT_1097735 [Mycena alexandri]|uniref:Uncharacterized protein n=1 Tax=Mycena alexandri TaxID=1745969 RepID=A0AAD6T1F1_9AGAR|nr:hypothetical protein C8F04DRAFT_1097735 [Mycena alexandri]
MKFTFPLLAAFVSAAVAAPAAHKRQTTCPLQTLGGLSVTANADPNGKTRWDVFADPSPSGLVQVGDLGWFVTNNPNGNEVFTATVGSQPDLFTFQHRNAQEIGVSGTGPGSTLLASGSPATFQVTCSQCNAFATGNDLAAAGCTMQLVDDSGNGLGQCVSFAAAESAVAMDPCDGSAGQVFRIFSSN